MREHAGQQAAGYGDGIRRKIASLKLPDRRPADFTLASLAVTGNGLDGGGLFAAVRVDEK